MLTQERLKELLHYDAERGVFTWLVNLRGRSARVGGVAGCRDGRGYGVIRIDGVLHRAHRLVWLYVHGQWPTHEVDHINGVRDDNRLVNLREATSTQNHQNRALSDTNTSGYLGVYWHKARQKWLARIAVNRKTHFLGRFDNPEEAAAAYVEAKRRLHTFQPETRKDEA